MQESVRKLSQKATEGLGREICLAGWAWLISSYGVHLLSGQPSDMPFEQAGEREVDRRARV